MMNSILLLILFIRLLNFRCIEGMSLVAVIYNFNLYFVIYCLVFLFKPFETVLYVLYSVM